MSCQMVRQVVYKPAIYPDDIHNYLEFGTKLGVCFRPVLPYEFPNDCNLESRVFVTDRHDEQNCRNKN